MKKEKLEKIVLTENFNLMEVFNTLFESRGVIDGVDGISLILTNYINNILSDNELKKQYFKGYDRENDVDKYVFTVPSEMLKNTDTLFMKNPIFNIYLNVMRLEFGDTERELDETNYEAEIYPKIINIDGQYYLNEPVFNLSFVIPNNRRMDIFDVSDKASHEICHAKKNFFEFIRQSKKRHELLNRRTMSLELIHPKEKDEIKKLIGRILYLCSKDEINARANQLYYQLKQFRRVDLDRDNINILVKKTKVYENFVEEFDEKIEQLNKMESEGNYTETETMIKILKWVYKNKFVKENPYEYLINLLIVRKNYFIRQIDKVKERVLYEAMTMPIIMNHPPIK